MKRALDQVILAFASCFFITYPLVRIAKSRRLRWTGAGLMGSLVGLSTAVFLPQDPVRGFLTLCGACLISVAISDRAEELLGNKDDQRIVIDEWAGYLVSIAFLPQTPFYLVGGFVLFRIIDTLKPLGLKHLGKIPGGWGVVVDDVAGGILVNAILHLLPLS